MMHLAPLPDRGVIEILGDDRVGFLQGLVSNDVSLAAPGRAVWAALLTPQGKYLADFFVLSDGARLLLEGDAGQLPSVLTRLSRYRLRAAVTLRAAPEFAVHVAWGAAPAVASIVAPDPRLPEAGWRVLATAPIAATAAPDDWQRHRLGLGLPEPADLEAEKTVLLEAGFDELGGVSWTKGCYMGQELTARTKYRGLVKRRLLPVTLSGPAASGSVVTQDGRDVGALRSVLGTDGLALLRLDALAGPLAAGEVRVTARAPAWMLLPEPV